MNSADRTNDGGHADEGLRKKPRTSLACEACRRRKSRCSGALGRRCHRCDELGTMCSLEDPRMAGQSSGTPQYAMHPPTIERFPPADWSADADDIAALRRRVVELEAREIATRQDEPQAHPHTPASSRQEPPPDKGRDEAWYRGAADPEAFSLIHGGMGSSAEHGLRDPVAEGILSASLAEHNIAGILPYPSLLVTRSKLPSHPYLRSACLLYAARCFHDVAMVSPAQMRQLENNLSQNLVAYHRGCRPSLESVFAGLIVSLLPHGQEGPDFDPARMVGMSYGQLRELGHSVFIQRVVDTLQSGLALSHIQQLLDDARLHFCIMTRVSWTNLSRCPNNDLPTALNHTHRSFTNLLREKGAMIHIDRHLMFEHEALDILMAQAHAWHRLERADAPSISDLREANKVTRRAVDGMSDLRRRASCETDLLSLSWVLCQISYLKWWTTIRNIWFTYHLATPLVVDEVQHEWIQGLSLGSQASADMLDQCLAEQWDLCVFPKAIATALILCYHTLSMAIAHLDAFFPEQMLPASLDAARLHRFADHVSTCPSLQATLRRATTTVDEYKRQIRVQSRRPSNAGLSPDAAPFSFNFLFDLDGRVNAVNQESAVPHWDPFAELGNGWNWQQPPESWDQV